MDVKQIYEYVNGATERALGKTDLVVAEDLSNIVEVGEALYNANAVDNYVKALVDRIGRTVFVDRVYKGSAPSILMTNVEYGSVTQKIQAEMPEAVETEDWELQDGTSYDPNVFHGNVVSVKYFNGKKTFEIDLSITDMQVKESFLNAEAVDRFIGMIKNEVSKSMTVKTEQLIRATMNNFIGETLYKEYPTGQYSATSGIRAVNLLKLYTTETGDSSVTADNYLTKPEFIRYATSIITEYIDKLSTMSVLFNMGGKARFTPSEYLHIVMLSKFKRRAEVYLQSDTYHNEMVKLPKAESVAYWQGTGTDYSLDNISKINIKTSENHDVECGNILAVMFDHDGLGVRNQEPRIRSNYNGKAEFTNFFHKWDADYFNDFDENFVVFFVA